MSTGRPGSGRDPADPSLDDAREALDYWEERACGLPRHAVRRRREARAMAMRWQARVAEAEREHYGRGLLGALLLLAAERRLPQPARRAGRQLARRTVQVAAVVVVAVLALVVAAAVALAGLLAEILHAV
jgi:hypothetical protein